MKKEKKVEKKKEQKENAVDLYAIYYLFWEKKLRAKNKKKSSRPE